MWVAIDGLLIDLDKYNHIVVIRELDNWCLFAYEPVSGLVRLLEYGTNGKERAYAAVREVALRIAAIKDCECKCQQS